MKLIIILSIVCSNVAFGQISNQLKSDSTDIYIHAFSQYCEQVIKYEPKVSIIYVQQGQFYSYILPDRVKGLIVKTLSDNDISKACKNGKHIYITKIIPLLNKKDVFYIGIIPFKVFTKKKQFHYVNEGGINFNYSFNTATGLFEFIDYKGGIPKIN